MRAVKAAKAALQESGDSADDDFVLNVDEHGDSDSADDLAEQFAIAAKQPTGASKVASTKEAGEAAHPTRRLSTSAVAARDRLQTKMAAALTFDDPLHARRNASGSAVEVLSCAPAASGASPLNSAWLMLTSDLSGELPSSFWLDFEVGGVDAAALSGVRLAILVDADSWQHSERHHVELHDLAPGYHLLRAFLIDASTGCCVKSVAAYAEAEFSVASPSGAAAAAPLAPRGFMFGQPAICAIARAAPIAWTRGEPLELLCDFFVSNVGVGDASEGGCSVRVLLDGDVVATARAWEALALRLRLPAAAQTQRSLALQLSYELVSPLGDVLRLPAYSSQPRALRIDAR